MTTEITYSGPLFDGTAQAEWPRFLAEAVQEVANQGRSEVMTIENQSFKHPTPYYEPQTDIRRGEFEQVINDRGIIYGPWLEGTSSRNQSTRFKGYGSYRRAKQALEDKVPDLVQHVLGPYLRRWGGHE